jgi:hypothetical protein
MPPISLRAVIGIFLLFSACVLVVQFSTLSSASSSNRFPTYRAIDRSTDQVLSTITREHAAKVPQSHSASQAKHDSIKAVNSASPQSQPISQETLDVSQSQPNITFHPASQDTLDISQSQSPIASQIKHDHTVDSDIPQSQSASQEEMLSSKEFLRHNSLSPGAVIVHYPFLDFGLFCNVLHQVAVGVDFALSFPPSLRFPPDKQTPTVVLLAFDKKMGRRLFDALDVPHLIQIARAFPRIRPQSGFEFSSMELVFDWDEGDTSTARAHGHKVVKVKPSRYCIRVLFYLFWFQVLCVCVRLMSSCPKHF